MDSSIKMSSPQRLPKVVVIASIITVLSTVLLMIGISTPYWLVNKGRLSSDFERLGLWMACFNGLRLPDLAPQQIFSHCRWIFHWEYNAIRADFLEPAWFIIVQLSCSSAFIIILVCMAITICLAFKCCYVDFNKRLRQLWISLTASVCLNCIGTITFGIKGNDAWMPADYWNRFGWSYVCTVLGTALEIFAAVLFFLCWQVRRKLLKQVQLKKSYKAVPAKPRYEMHAATSDMAEELPPYESKSTISDDGSSDVPPPIPPMPSAEVKPSASHVV